MFYLNFFNSLHQYYLQLPRINHMLCLIKMAKLSQKKKIALSKKMQFMILSRSAINAAKFLNENLIVLGDDDGRVKIYDIRSHDCVYSVHENEESITAFEIDQSMNFLLSTSLDGYLSVFDLRVNSNAKTAVYAMSDCMEEDLTGLCLIKGGKFVCVSTSEGSLLLFKWDYFGDFKDRITGHPSSIDTIIKIDEQTILTGCEDGLLRGVSIFPNSIDRILGQHEENEQFPISKIDLDRSGLIVASISHDNSIKFYEIVDYFNKRKDVPLYEPPEEFAERVKQKGDADEFEDEDSSDEDDMDEEDKPKKKKVRTKNLKQSEQQVKQKKFQQFFDKL